MITSSWRGVLSGTILLGLLALSMPGRAQDIELTDAQALSAAQFAVNNTNFVLYHEIGHLMVDQFSLPILGKQEDAVDNIATYMLLAQDSDTANNALIDSAYGWLLADAAAPDEMEAADFYDEHSLDLQRAYSIVCLMTGKDPEGFADVADNYELDEDRRYSCQDDYARFEQSLSGLLQPYLGTAEKIPVVYEEAPEELDHAREILKNSGILEAAADEIAGSFALPRPIKFSARACGEPNAFYDPDTVEVSICYELVDDYLSTIIADMLDEEASKG